MSLGGKLSTATFWLSVVTMCKMPNFHFSLKWECLIPYTTTVWIKTHKSLAIAWDIVGMCLLRFLKLSKLSFKLEGHSQTVPKRS